STEIAWQRECSPRLVLVRQKQDTALRCDVLAPSGTHITWYKNNQLLQRQGAPLEVSHAPSTLEVLEEETNMVEYRGAPLVSPAAEGASARLLYVSLVYLDCADQHHVADYSIEVTTPSNAVYSRNFTVQLIGRGQNGRSCRFATVINYLPRTYLYSPEARAELGATLTLPCRVQGLSTQQSWLINNSPLPLDNSNYQVLSNGDLLIWEVNQESYGRYTCRAFSTRYRDTEENVYTSVIAQERTM
ncbi:hypothetical protein OTU49_004630, partial [Cherax quadricarinatus]